jgi:hypothetical protein
MAAARRKPRDAESTLDSLIETVQRMTPQDVERTEHETKRVPNSPLFDPHGFSQTVAPLCESGVNRTQPERPATHHACGFVRLHDPAAAAAADYFAVVLRHYSVDSTVDFALYSVRRQCWLYSMRLDHAGGLSAVGTCGEQRAPMVLTGDYTGRVRVFQLLPLFAEPDGGNTQNLVFVSQAVHVPCGAGDAPNAAAVRSVAALYSCGERSERRQCRSRPHCKQRCLCNSLTRLMVCAVDVGARVHVQTLEWPTDESIARAQRHIHAVDGGELLPTWVGGDRVELAFVGSFQSADTNVKPEFRLALVTRAKRLWVLHGVARLDFGIELAPAERDELCYVLERNTAPYQTSVCERVNSAHASHGFVAAFGQHNAHVLAPPPPPPTTAAEDELAASFDKLSVADTCLSHMRDKGHVRCACASESFIALYRHDETIWLLDCAGQFRARIPEARALFAEAEQRYTEQLQSSTQLQEHLAHLALPHSCKCYACAVPLLRPQRCDMVAIVDSRESLILLLDYMCRVRIVRTVCVPAEVSALP